MEANIQQFQTKEGEKGKDNRNVIRPVRILPSMPIWSRPRGSIPLMPSGARYVTVPSSNSPILFSSSEWSAGRRAPGNGLRQFAVHVLAKVEQKGRTTYNEVADELVQDMAYCTLRAPQCEEKNIRRRVYDALNVLIALKIIHKDRKSIRWTGMPGTMHDQCTKLEQDKAERQKRIGKKKKELKELLVQLVAFKSLITRNKTQLDRHVPCSRCVGENALDGNSDEDAAVKVNLPFIVVNTNKETVVDCWLSPDRRAYTFNFDHQFEIHDDVEVLRRMGLTYGLETGECSDGQLNTLLCVMPCGVHRMILDLVSDSLESPSQFSSTSCSAVPVVAGAVSTHGNDELQSETPADSSETPADSGDRLSASTSTDPDQMDTPGSSCMQSVTAMEVTCDDDADDDDDSQTATPPSENLLCTDVELATVDSAQLGVDADNDDWLSSLLKYDDENST